MEQVNLTQRGDTASLAEMIAATDRELIGRNTIFVGSSRLPQKLDSIPEFFSGLLKVAVHLDPKLDVLLSAEGTACDKFVVRIGELFDIPVVRLKQSKGRVADAALAKFADQMTVLSVRKNGNLHSAVLQRLQANMPTRVLLEPSLTKKALADELLSLGATGWYLLREDSEASDQVSVTPPCNTSTTRKRVSIDLQDVDSSEYLLHWTRRRVGPWPDQSEHEFVDDLLFGLPRKDHREVAALRRILATGRILASNGLTRDPRPVVCFSDISFEQLLARRVFRPHLSRWDFEPFGIAISKSWLKTNGAIAVQYGDESHWESMSENERPFFQLNQVDAKVDWTIENEWRIVGDVDLRQVPYDAATVFVPSRADAAEIGGFSRWPVVVLNEALKLGKSENEPTSRK